MKEPITLGGRQFRLFQTESPKRDKYVHALMDATGISNYDPTRERPEVFADRMLKMDRSAEGRGDVLRLIGSAILEPVDAGVWSEAGTLETARFLASLTNPEDHMVVTVHLRDFCLAFAALLAYAQVCGQRPN